MDSTRYITVTVNGEPAHDSREADLEYWQGEVRRHGTALVRAKAKVDEIKGEIARRPFNQGLGKTRVFP